MRRSSFCQVALLLGFVLSFPLMALAQTEAGRIKGQVLDRQGAPLAGAKLTATNEETKKSVAVATDAGGHFIIENLVAGEYQVVISAKGFVTRTHKIRVNPGRTSKLNTRLKSAPAPSHASAVPQPRTPNFLPST